MALLALNEWKDKYLFKEQMPSAQGRWHPQLQSEWEPLHRGQVLQPPGVSGGGVQGNGPRVRCLGPVQTAWVWSAALPWTCCVD